MDRRPTPFGRPPPRGRPSRLRQALELLDDLAWRGGRALRRGGRAARRGGGRAARVLRRGGGRARRAWSSRPPGFRRRVAAVLAVLALYALLRFVPLPLLPCVVSPAKECPPEDDAIALVPRDAYAYVHLSLEHGSGQLELADALVARVPRLAGAADGAAAALLGLPPSAQLRPLLEPWIGDEAAIAVLAGPGGRPLPLALLSVADEDASRGFRALAAARVRTRRLGEFLALGRPAALRALARARRDGGSLADAPHATEARDALPQERLADAYVSAAGLERLLAGRGGAAAQLDTFVHYGASRGLAAALVAAEEGLELSLVSLLDPQRARATPGFFAAFPGFEPGLAELFPRSALAYLGIARPRQTVRLLLEQADAAAPGIARAFDRLDRRLGSEQGVRPSRDVLPLLRGEAAVAAFPSRVGPQLTFVFDGVDEERAGRAFARLQAPLIGGLRPGQTGQAPSFERRRVAGVTVRSVRLSPALELAYATFDGKLVVSTAFEGVRDALAEGPSLAAAPGFEATASGSAEAVSALVFLNLAGLVEFGEPRGLAEIEPYSTFRADIARLRALGLTVRSGEETLETRAFLNIE